MQVLLLHLFSAYFPGLVQSHELVQGQGKIHTIASFVQKSPLFFLYDGYAGVFIFFYISGYVLTGVFGNFKFHWLAEVQARIVRLWVPTVFYGLLALLLFIAFQGAHVRLAAINNSDFIGCCWVVDKSWSFLFREIFVTPLFTGYQNSPVGELFPLLQNYLLNSGYSLNSPVWSMSVELQGSFLVLGLVYLRAKAPVLWVVFLVCSFAWLPMAYVAFELGHVSAVMRLGERTYQRLSRVISGLAIVAIIGGILLVWPHRNDPYLLVGTGLIFFGVMSSPLCRGLLSHRTLVRLGDLSFTIYLLHWSIVFGPGAWIVLKMIPLVGLQGSRIVGAVFVVASVFYLSVKLVRVDAIAISLAHSAKRGQYSGLLARLSFWSRARGIADGRGMAVRSTTPN